SARPELRNKTSLLGFLGITPDVSIWLENLSLPVDQLTFVFIGFVKGTAAPVEFAVEMFDFRDATIFSVSQTTDVKPAPNANLLFTIRLLRFPHVGRYKIRLRADSRVVYNSSFV